MSEFHFLIQKLHMYSYQFHLLGVAVKPTKGASKYENISIFVINRSMRFITNNQIKMSASK